LSHLSGRRQRRTADDPQSRGICHSGSSAPDRIRGRFSERIAIRLLLDFSGSCSTLVFFA
jgi:hypothetical protein